MDKTKIAGVLVVLAVIVAVLVITLDRQQNIATTTNLTPPSASDTLTNLASRLQVKPQIRDSMYVDWIDENNIVVPLTGKQFIMGSVDVKNTEKYKELTDIEKVNFDSMQPLEQKADSYFAEKGFAKNERNSKTYTRDVAPYKTVGYQNGDLKCMIRLDANTDPFGSFFCGTIDTAQIDLQQKMDNILPYKVTKDGISSLRVQKIENDFAIGTYSEAFTGYTWMAKKEDKKWKILWKSNDIAPCADMERLGIPESIYGNCYTPEG